MIKTKLKKVRYRCRGSIRRLTASVLALAMLLSGASSGIQTVYAVDETYADVIVTSEAEGQEESDSENLTDGEEADAGDESITETEDGDGTAVDEDSDASYGGAQDEAVSYEAAVDGSDAEEACTEASAEVTDGERQDEDSEDDVDSDADSEGDVDSEVMEPSDESRTPSKEAVEAASELDFSSGELLVKSEGAGIEGDEVLGSFDGVYLLGYDTEDEAREAFEWYFDNADLVDVNTDAFMTAEDSSDTGEEGTSGSWDDEENPLSELAAAVEEISDDADTSGPLIALIDSGVPEDAQVEAAVSMLGGETADEYGHGSKMLEYIQDENLYARVVSIKVFGSSGTTDAAAVYAGIKYAVEAGADIINLSLYAADSENNAIVKDALNEALEAGITVVAAAGNDGADASEYIAACIDAVTAVGSCDSDAVKTSASNFGDAVDYYVVARSTSEAAARMSGILSRNDDPADAQGVYDPEEVDISNNDPSETVTEDLSTATGTSNGQTYYIYGEDYFPEAYSAGYLILDPDTLEPSEALAENETTYSYATGSGVKNLAYEITNTSYDADVYADFPNGAYYDGSYIDVRIYPWVDDNVDEAFLTNNSDTAQNNYGLLDLHSQAEEDCFGSVYLKFCFYESGHVGESGYEVNFKGIIEAQDLDDIEGWDPNGGKVWLSEETHIQYYSGYYSNTYHTVNAWCGIDSNTTTENPKHTIWFTIEGTSKTIRYVNNEDNSGLGSGLGVLGTPVHYRLVETDDGGVVPDGLTLDFADTYVMMPAYYSVEDGVEVDGYEFSGWYLDEDLTIKADIDTITEETTFYGTYYPSNYAYVDIEKYDSQTGEALSGAVFTLYEYSASSKGYSQCGTLTDNGDGTYSTGRLEYTSDNQGMFYIKETSAPAGHTLDSSNVIYFTLAGVNEIELESSNSYNSAGTYSGTDDDTPITLKAYNTPWSMKIQMTKTDSETGVGLSGAVYTVYEWNGSSYTRYYGPAGSASSAYILTEGSTGVYTSDWLYWSSTNQGKFAVVETGTPEGYYGDWADGVEPDGDSDVGDRNWYYFTITGTTTQTAELSGYTNLTTVEDSNTDERVTGIIDLTKYDTEAGEGTTVSQGDASMTGATYTLHAASDIYHQDGATTYGTYTAAGLLYAEGDEIKLTLDREKTEEADDGVNYYYWDPEGTDTLTMGEALKVVIEGVELGEYYFVEETAGEGYLVDGTGGNEDEITVTVSYDGETVLVVEDYGQESAERVMKQSFMFYKFEDDGTSLYSGLEGAGFSVYLVSDLFGDEAAGMSDSEVLQAMIDTYLDQETMTYEEMTAKAVPALVYASADDEDVVNGLLTKTVVYADGTSVSVPDIDAYENAYFAAEMFSDAAGKVTTADLPYGRYVIVETTVPEGYDSVSAFVVDVDADEDDAVIDGDGDGTSMEEVVLTFAADGSFEAYVKIRKTDSVSGGAVQTTGAQYLIVDTDGDWFDSWSSGKTSKQIEAYEERAAYYVDGEFYGYLVVMSSQGEYLGTEDNPWSTTAVSTAGDGDAVYVMTPQTLPSGDYELIEVAAPDGYVLYGSEGMISKSESYDSDEGNGTFYESAADGAWTDKSETEKIIFTVSSMTAVMDETAEDWVVTVSQKNDPAVGKISIYKEGEALTDASQSDTFLEWISLTVTSAWRALWKTVKSFFGTGYEEWTDEEVRNFADYSFTYELKPVEGAEFEIRAEYDIYAPDGSGEIIFEAGELVCTLTTDENGEAWTGDADWTDGAWEGEAMGLPLGSYLVTEVHPGEGFSLSDDNALAREVVISYAGQEVPVVYADTEYENPRQKTDISVTKTDAETGEVLEGAVFGLFAAEDILGYDGGTLISADTLIATAVTGSDGVAVFDEDLPLSTYYVKELLTPEGYATNTKVETVDACWKDDFRDTIEIELSFDNVLTSVQINLMDWYTEVELSGAVFKVYDGEGAEAASFTSLNGGNEVLRGLEIKETYTLVEEAATSGYTFDLYLKEEYESVYAAASDDVVDAVVNATDEINKVEFYVEDAGELQIVSVFAKPASGDIEIQKEGEAATGYIEDEEGNLTITYEILGLPGAEYALVADGDIEYPDQETGILFEDGAAVLDVYMEADSGSILCTAYDIETEEGTLTDVSGYVGIKFDEDATVSEIEEFYDTFGNEIERQIPSDSEIESGEFSYSGTAVNQVIVTDDSGRAVVSGLPLGSYKVVEVSAPDGYVRDLTEAVAEAVLDDGDIEAVSGWKAVASVAYTNARQKEDTVSTVPGVSVLMLESGLKVTKTAQNSVYNAGDTVIYTMTVTNIGETTLTGVCVTDNLEGEFVSASSDDLDAEAVLISGNTAQVGVDMEPGDTLTLVYHYVIPEDTQIGTTISNTARASGTPLAYKGYDSEGEAVLTWTDDDGVTWYDVSPYDDVESTDTAKIKIADDEEPEETTDTETTVERDPKITVTKTADKDVYDAGATAVYTIEVENTGSDDLTDVVLKELLLTDGTYTSTTKGFISGTTVEIGELSVGETVVVTYEYTVPADTSPGTAFDNIVTVYGRTAATVNPEDPYNPDGTPNYLPDITVSDYDDERIWTEEMSGGLTVTKKGISSSGTTYVSGAEYTLYALDDVVNILGEVIITAGTKIETAVTGSEGVAVFDADLPVGLYYIEETKAPDGYYSTSRTVIVDFTSAVYDDQTEYLAYTAEYENAQTEVIVYLKDDLTYNDLSGAAMQLVDDEGDVAGAWITKTASGYRISGLKTDTHYTITEIIAREGYLIDFTGYDFVCGNGETDGISGSSLTFVINDVETEVTESGSIDKTTVPEAAQIILYNKFVTGDILLNKDGEILESVTFTAKAAALIKSLFTYGKTQLEGVEFTVTAAEDIYHPDGVSGIIYEEGDLVYTGVRTKAQAAVSLTGTDGTVKFEEMYLGQYAVTETETLEGYALLEEPVYAALAYIDAYTDPVTAVQGTLEISNLLQRVDISVVKKDMDSGELLEGAVFGLYTAEPLTYASGEEAVAADTLLETSITEEDGTAVFESDIPAGSYYIKEEESPDGYTMSYEVVQIEVESDTAVPVHEVEVVFYDEITKVSVEKLETDTTDYVEGAVLAVYSEAGTILESWTTGGEAYEVQGLTAGEEYILREIYTPSGYLTADDIEFTVEDRDEDDGTYLGQAIVMYDELKPAATSAKSSGSSTESTDGAVTGDSAAIRLYAALAAAGILGTAECATYMVTKRRRSRRN